MEKLTYQDLSDSRELANFEEVFGMQTKNGNKRGGVADYDQSGADSDLMEEANEKPKQLSDDEKPYLHIEELQNGDMRVILLIPPFEQEDIKAGFKQKLTFFFKKRKLEQMKAKFAKYKSIVVFIDGAVTQNPGPTASAAFFYGRKVEMAEKVYSLDSSSEDLSDFEGDLEQQQTKSQQA